MQDAFNLGWKLASVIGGRSPDSILDTYAMERKPVAQQVQNHAENIHKVLFDHTRPLAVRITETRSARWHDQCIYGISGLAHNYRGAIWSPDGCSMPANGPAPGERAPNAVLSEVPLLRLHDTYRHTRATLLMMPVNDTETARCKALLQQFQTAYGASVKPVIISRGVLDDVNLDNYCVNAGDDLHRWYGVGSSGRLYVVRPDLYIGFAGLLDEIQPLETYLAHWFNSA